MQTLIVVISLDVLEDLPARFALAGEELIGRKTLRFQRTEKCLRLGVLIAISPAAHTQVSSDDGQRRFDRLAAVLAALIGGT